ncbi:MAG: hypothetical protein LAO76_10265 [Acidobacteriia bacterium]|nr:hypothetical protein [Terriglobia bacterium]
MGFKEVEQDPQRQKNDEYFSERWGKPRLIRADDDGIVYSLLREEINPLGSNTRILIDYSSMSRLWYTAVLNWVRFFPGPGSIDVDLLYAVGHHKAEAPPVVIKEILSLPGCEGLPLPLSKSVAVFGLGFEGSAALCVLDRLEPDVLLCYLADPAAFPDYPDRTRNANKEVIALADACLKLPLFSVERCFGNLAELVSWHKSEAKTNITLVPMGPKPHVLAALLVAMRFEEVSCLRVGYLRHKPEQVGTTGDIVTTRVEFKA